MPDFQVREIVPNVCAVLGGVCNRGISAGKDGTLVVDSGISVAEATPLYQAARERAGQGHLSLFNTHSHGDHVYGNQIFAACPIIASSDVREVLAARGEEQLAGWRAGPYAETVAGVRLTLPSVTFDERLVIYLGGIEVHLIRMGTAHSPGDAVAWLPEQRVLFAGDLLFNDLVPAMPPGGDTSTWARALEKLEELGAEHVIPGHGPIEPPTALGSLRDWIISLRAHVGAAVAGGADRETASKEIATAMRGAYPARGNEARLPVAIERAFENIARERGEETRKNL